MAVPFGGHPTFGHYIEWARSEGCQIDQGYLIDNVGQSHSVTKIVAPSGKWVIDVGTQHSEHLVSTTIARLDRRLGLRSPYFSIDDSGSH